jgi:hypothetical protein
LPMSLARGAVRLVDSTEQLLVLLLSDESSSSISCRRDDGDDRTFSCGTMVLCVTALLR